MAVSDTLINTLFDGRYRIVRRLGSGGMANVYLAEDEELGRRVAIKILNDRHASDDSFVERFRREAKNAAGLSHPNIVSIYDRGEAEGTYYIAMEYLEGRSLKDRIVAEGPLPIAAAIECVRQILRAVGFAHRSGIVHRDIKPHNVMLAQEGSERRYKVTDFGISRTSASQMTEAGSIVGTAQYLSPEQARGAAVDQRSDLYSVGIVLFELLTGKLPFNGETPLEIAMKHLSEIPKSPSTRRPEVPPDLDMVVLRALAKDPADRFESAEEMDAELARVAAGSGVTAETAEAATAVLAGAGLAESAPTMISRRPVVTPPPTRSQTEQRYYDYEPPRRQRSFWPWLLAILLLLGALVAGVYVWQQIQDEINETKPIAVPFVEGLRAPQARRRIRNAGLKPIQVDQSNANVPRGVVFDQEPDAGERIQRGNAVRYFVSTGKPRVAVPEVVGARESDAVATLRNAKLVPKVVDIFSDEPAGIVIAQDPPGGASIVEGSDVRLNVSKGPQQSGLPNVVGRSYEDAAQELRQAGFEAARRDVDAPEPKGTVVSQSPVPGTLAPPGTRVTLNVSTGESATSVPDVRDLAEDDARATLENEGWTVVIRDTPTSNPDEDGIVISQTPPPGQKAEPGSEVTLFVGRLKEEPAPPPPTTPPPPPPPIP
ncbi:MAG: Stk1 family PASTA domain-containing Ser/Thr kinase [Actinobacteria bacterium]|nr:Stk1 family PASTA domain-containing Ser/Thr kinase [Actinomycetota bacterium]